MDVLLQRLAASTEPLEAASWQKLVELVAHLESTGSEQELWGQILLQELHLYKPEPPDPIRNRQMQRFMDEWRAQHPDPAMWGKPLDRELLRRFPPKPGIQVSVRVDWQDYAPLREGLPEMHYRLQVKRPGKTLSEDRRANDPVDAERILCEAFGW
jgi:hypothetical protein